MALYAMQSPERLPLEATCQLAAAAVDLVVYIAKSSDGRWVSSVPSGRRVDGSNVVTNELFGPVLKVGRYRGCRFPTTWPTCSPQRLGSIAAGIGLRVVAMTVLVIVAILGVGAVCGWS